MYTRADRLSSSVWLDHLKPCRRAGTVPEEHEIDDKLHTPTLEMGRVGGSDTAQRLCIEGAHFVQLSVDCGRLFYES